MKDDSELLKTISWKLSAILFVLFTGDIQKKSSVEKVAILARLGLANQFTEPAEVFLVVYPGPIDSAIITQMKAFAIGTELSGKRVGYGVVDGADIGRLQVAYPKSFGKQ